MTANSDTFLIDYKEMQQVFSKVLNKIGFNRKRSESLAQIFTENSIDGVYTHGVNRFPRFVQYFKNGWTKADAEPELVNTCGAIEQWTGNSGPGPLNALWCTDRAMEIARTHGIGCVSLANTNHWMRGGTYGWKAAKAGFAFMAWTNTTGNMPPWGASSPKLGNNPLVFAVPFKNEAIVLDMAMSQFSFGAMELQQLKQQPLPVPGGFDKQGRLTDDPSAILESRQVLPIGYWKGAGLSLLLDIFATVFSGGLSVKQISEKEGETNVSQVFIAIDLSQLQNFKTIGSAINEIINDYKSAVGSENQIVFPGEKVLQTRERNKEKGIPVMKVIWDEVLSLA